MLWILSVPLKFDTSGDSINALTRRPNNTSESSDAIALRQSLEILTKQLESLETAVQSTHKLRPHPIPQRNIVNKDIEETVWVLVTWPDRSLMSKLSFKLLWTSSVGGQQLVPPSVTHQPYQRYNSEFCNINTILKIPGLFDPLPLTFLLDSGAAVSVVHLGALTNESRKKIVTAGLTAPI